MTDSGTNFIQGMISIAKSNVQLSEFNKAGSNLNALSTYKNTGAPADSKQALQQFEGMFLGQLLKLMFDTVPTDNILGGGYAETTFRSMLTDEYGMKIASGGGIGIAGQLQKSMMQFQNITHDAHQTVATADAAAKAYTKVYNF